MSLQPNITFTVCDPTSSLCKDFAFPYAAFALQASFPLLKFPNGSTIHGDTSRLYFPIKPSNNLNAAATLGRTFLQETHVFANFDRGTFNLSQAVLDSTAEPQIIAVKAPPENKTASHPHLSFADIAGIAISAAAALATTCYLAFAKFKGYYWPFKSTQPAAEEPSKPELDGTGRPWVEMSSADRKELPGTDGPHEVANPGQDVELMGTVPLFELPAAT